MYHNKTEKMTRKQERELVKKMRQGDNNAREELILSLHKWLKWIAKDYFKEGAVHSFEDLLQEASIGLIKAVDVIKKKGLRKTNRLQSYTNRAVRNHLKKIIRVEGYMIKTPKRNIIDDRTDKIMAAITHSWDNSMGEGMHGGFNFMMPEDHTPGRLALHDELLNIMDEFLTHEEEAVMQLRYGLGHEYFDTPDWQKPNKTLSRSRIAEVLGIKEARVVYVEAQAMEKLQTGEVQVKLLPWEDYI